jgi:hypothetical protein
VVITSALHAEGRGFDPRSEYDFFQSRPNRLLSRYALRVFALPRFSFSIQNRSRKEETEFIDWELARDWLSVWLSGDHLALNLCTLRRDLQNKLSGPICDLLVIHRGLNLEMILPFNDSHLVAIASQPRKTVLIL